MNYEEFNDSNLKKIISQFGYPKKIKILYISTYKPDYTRTESLLELFQRNKINCKIVLTGKSKWRHLKAVLALLKHQKRYDLIFVGFRGQEILPFIRLFTKKPIMFDAFISVYDTLCFDRKIFRPNSLIGKFLRWYDTYLCKISSQVLVDTKAHANYFRKEFGAKNVDWLYVGCNKKLFRPIKIKKDKDKFIVFWYGTANPLQGIDTMLKAAKILEKNNEVHLRMVGPVRKKYARLINRLNLKNVEFIDYIPYKQLPIEIAKADVCLGGHFSSISKAQRVIAGKVFQFLACGKQIILSDNPANRELFNDERLVSFVKQNNENALANKIMEILK